MLTTPPTAEVQYLAETARATWWLVYATWALALITIGVAGGTLWMMWRQIRDGRATAQLNLHLQLLNDFESEAMSAVRSRVAAVLLQFYFTDPTTTESIL